MKGKNLQPGILYPAGLSFKFDGEIKSFSGKQKLIKEFSTASQLYSKCKRNFSRQERQDKEKIYRK